MTRRQTIFLSSISAALTLLVAIATAVVFSYEEATRHVIDDLTALNREAIAHSNRIYDDAVDALQAIAKNQSPPCSEEHIAQMRQATANNWQVTGIAYFEDEMLRCSAWGPLNAPFHRAPIAYVTNDGISVSIGVNSKVSRSAPRIGLYIGNYGALIDPDVLLHDLAGRPLQFAVASAKGLLLATRNNPDPRLLRSLIENPRSGTDEHYVFSATTDAELIAVAIRPRQDIFAQFRTEMFQFLPLALLAAFIAIGWIAWVAHRRLSPLGELKAAVRQRQFIVHYQPIIDLKTGHCSGAEALVRWERNGAIVSPAQFIDLAETSGLILAITDQVVDCVLRDLGSELRSQSSMHVAINLSASDVSTGRILDLLERALPGTGIRNEQIWLEATERGFVDVEGARAVIARAHERGHVIAIDDFGTGFSSLQYLESLSVDTLKIDKSFVDTIGQTSSKSPVLSHIIEMARALNLYCVAEGVETEAQMDYLRGAGVEMAQGWAISKPLPATEFLAFYRKRNFQSYRLPRSSGGSA
ncbi:MAG: EAL domain-containing protein [Rhizobium sp.]